MTTLAERIRRRYEVPPGKAFKLSLRDPADRGLGELAPLLNTSARERADAYLAINRETLARSQELLWASDSRSVLIILQAMDAAGKDSTIKHVMSGVNPQGCEVHSFKHPSAQELDHNFLWRYWDKVPRRGHIGIFNRSYYEEVLIVRVHPPILAAERLPPSKRGAALWKERFEDINHFERHLVRNGTTVLKFFLNISKQEQRRRLLQRIDNPEKFWKFSEQDLTERGYWRQYMQAYQQLLSATSTEWAPWYVIPADHRHLCRALVAAIIADQIKRLDLSRPALSPETAKRLARARRELEKSG